MNGLKKKSKLKFTVEELISINNAINPIYLGINEWS